MNALQALRNRQGERVARALEQGSPPYRWIVPVTAAAATSVLYPDTDLPASRRYAPLDWLEIVNMEGAITLTLTINGVEVHTVPPNTVRTIEDTALRHIAVTNTGAGNTTLGDIIVTVMRAPMTADRAARR